MSGINSGYDLSVSTFTPEGRILQIEYAMKAVDNSTNVIAIELQDGILFAVEKVFISKTMVPGSNSQIFCIDKHITIAVSGLLSDARALIQKARAEAIDYRKVFQQPIPGHVLAERMSLYMHWFTLAWSERPFGVCLLLGASEPIDEHNVDDENMSNTKPNLALFSIDASGACYQCYGNVLGKGQRNARTEIEKLDRENLLCSDALVDIAKILKKSQDLTCTRNIEIEMAWISKESNWQHAMIDPEVVKKAVDDACLIIEAEET